MEPDYEGMKRFKPLIDKFKDVFFDGEDSDPACGISGARGRGTRGRGFKGSA